MKSAVEQINELKCWDFSITYGGYKHAEEVVVVRKDDIFKILEEAKEKSIKEIEHEIWQHNIVPMGNKTIVENKISDILEKNFGKFEGEKMKTKIELNQGFKGSGINEVDTSRLVKEALRRFSLIPCEKGENPLLHLQELAEIGIDIGRCETFESLIQTIGCWEQLEVKDCKDCLVIKKILDEFESLKEKP